MKNMKETMELQHENKMGVEPVKKLLLTMSIPMMISMLVQALYNIIDSIFVAHIGENALTAVTLAFPIQNLMIAVGSGTGVGINALLSRSLGERDYENANKAANTGILLAVLSGAAFALFGIFGSEMYFSTQTDIKEVVQYGQEFLTICSVFSFALFGQMTFERLLQSTGKTIYTMISQATGAIINTVLNPILIFGLLGFPAMGIRGSATATVIGQSVATLIAIFFNVKKNQEIKISRQILHPEAATVKKIYAVGIPSAIMIAIGSVMTYGINRILITFSTTAAAVFGIYFRLQSFVFMPVFGLNNGMIPILAYNWGAGKKERMLQTIKYSIIYAVVIMLIGLAILQIIPDKLLMMFNANETMMSMGVHSLRVISLSFIFAGFGIMVSSVFQVMDSAVLSLVISVIRQLVVLLPAAYLLSLTGSVNAVWWAFPIAEVVCLIFSVIFLKNTYNKKIKIME